MNFNVELLAAASGEAVGRVNDIIFNNDVPIPEVWTRYTATRVPFCCGMGEITAPFDKQSAARRTIAGLRQFRTLIYNSTSAKVTEQLEALGWQKLMSWFGHGGDRITTLVISRSTAFEFFDHHPAQTVKAEPKPAAPKKVYRGMEPDSDDYVERGVFRA